MNSCLMLISTLVLMSTGGAHANGRCGDQIDCMDMFRKCITPHDVCDKHRDCRSRVDEEFCECYTDDDCAHNQECVNQFPVLGKKCIDKVHCEAGLTQQGPNCRDIDECYMGLHNCTKDQYCINTVGSFECRCSSPGLVLNKRTGRCEDIDECLQPGRCDAPGRCKNTFGSFECSCPDHLVRVEQPDRRSFTCQEKDFCIGKVCEDHLVCKNDGKGGAACVCPIAYHDDVDGHCVPRDLCLQANICERMIQAVKCVSGLDTYSCEPDPDSHELNDTITLDDAGVRVAVSREFRCNNSDSCGANEVCMANICLCSQGFVYDRKSHICKDVDECTTQRHSCPERLRCDNHVGGYSCTCPDGFRQVERESAHVASGYDSVHCVDIDECLEDSHTCPFGCRNVLGSYECICRAGYRTDESRKLCVPIGPSTALLVAKFGRLFLAEMNFTSGIVEFEQLATTCEDVRTSPIFAYLQPTNEAFFVDEDRGAIYRRAEDGNCSRIVSQRENITTIALDWTYSKVYWTDLEGVAVSELDGSHVKRIAHVEEQISNMVVDPYNGWMLFSTEAGQLWRVGLDGTRMSRILEGVNVTAIAFDVEESSIALQTDSETMLCPEDATDTGGCVELEFAVGNDTANLTLVDMFVDFAVLESADGELLLVSRNGKQVVRVSAPNSTFKSMRGRVLHTMKQPAGGNRCRGQCSHLCVNSPSVERFACLCPDTLSEGGAVSGCTPFFGRQSFADETLTRSASYIMFVTGILLSIVGWTCIVYGGSVQCRRRWVTLNMASTDRQPIMKDTQLSSFNQIHNYDEIKLGSRPEPVPSVVSYSHDNPVFDADTRPISEM